MSTHGAILPYPHQGQQQVINDAKRFNWLAAGRRWRKTTLLMSIAMETAAAGKIFFWGAPTFDQVRIGWGETVMASQGILNMKMSTMTATWEQTGGRIIYRSLDNPDNARGHSADVVGMDEVADINPRAYYEVLRAMLMDTQGDLWAVGTPKGRNWFYIEWLAAKDREDAMSWQIPTKGCEIVDGGLVRNANAYENPDIPWHEIENIYNTTPVDIFRQEYMADFVEGQGVVFRNIKACMNALETTPEEHEGHKIIAGVDWGKQNDFTTLDIGCETCKKEVARDRFNQIDWHFQYDRLVSIMRKWNVSLAMIEYNSIGGPGFEALERAGLPVVRFDTTATTKPPLIENMALVLEKEEWQFQDDPIWTGEMEAYTRKVSAITGRSQYSAPEGLHDDTVIARALMLWCGQGLFWYVS